MKRKLGGKQPVNPDIASTQLLAWCMEQPFDFAAQKQDAEGS
jgi:hypothetical protein